MVVQPPPKAWIIATTVAMLSLSLVRSSSASVNSNEPDAASANRLDVLLAQAIAAAPGFTLRGGTNVVLRGIVARALGVR